VSRDAAPRSVALSGVHAAFDFIDAVSGAPMRNASPTKTCSTNAFAQCRIRAVLIRHRCVHSVARGAFFVAFLTRVEQGDAEFENRQAPRRSQYISIQLRFTVFELAHHQ